MPGRTKKAAKLGMPPEKHPAGPVETRSVAKDGWTVEQAVQLVADGYTPEQVERLTGHKVAGVARTRGMT